MSVSNFRHHSVGFAFRPDFLEQIRCRFFDMPVDNGKTLVGAQIVPEV
jgi:hypothetical protein